MEITQNIQNKIITAIKNSPAYRGREEFMDAIYNEVVRNCESLIKHNEDNSNIDIYLKKIATKSIINVISNKSSTPKDTNSENHLNTPLENISVTCLFDENENVLFDLEIPSVQPETIDVSSNSLESIKNIIIKLEHSDQKKNYKSIFELRYLKGMTNSEIASKLNINEQQVSECLLLILQETGDILLD